jgi:hypothetical protein
MQKPKQATGTIFNTQNLVLLAADLVHKVHKRSTVKSGDETRVGRELDLPAKHRSANVPTRLKSLRRAYLRFLSLVLLYSKLLPCLPFEEEHDGVTLPALGRGGRPPEAAANESVSLPLLALRPFWLFLSIKMARGRGAICTTLTSSFETHLRVNNCITMQIRCCDYSLSRMLTLLQPLLLSVGMSVRNKCASCLGSEWCYCELRNPLLVPLLKTTT